MADAASAGAREGHETLWVETYYLQCLAHASYIVAHGGNAFIVDPRRDVDMYLKEINERGLKLRGVLLTHVHADFVSGHWELIDRCKTSVMIGEKAGVSFPHLGVTDGDTFSLSSHYSIRALPSPGHTPGCVTWLLADRTEGDKPIKAFTGDTLFVGNVGRPDLLGSVGFKKEDLASMLYDTLTTKLMTLPDDCAVHPAHGAGSPCGKGLSKELSSTIGKEKATNPALQFTDRDAFISYITDGQPHAPQYFIHAVTMNKSGAPAVATTVAGVPALNAVQFQEAMGREVEGMGKKPIVLDTREAVDWATGHIKGSYNFAIGDAGGVKLEEKDGNFGIWLGTLLGPDQPVLVVAPLGKELETVERMARIGYHTAVGYLQGGIDTWASAGMETDFSMRYDTRTDSAKSREVLLSPEYTIVDVRNPGEYNCTGNGHFKSAIHRDLNFFPGNLTDLPKDAKYLVYCSGGYRSAIAVSVMRAHGLEAYDFIGGYRAIRTNMIELTTGESPVCTV